MNRCTRTSRRWTSAKTDGIYAAPGAGAERRCLRQFLSDSRGSVICGPVFTPDFTTVFCAIQHPGEGDRLESPISTWPDGATPPRPSVTAMTKTDGDIIGS